MFVSFPFVCQHAVKFLYWGVRDRDSKKIKNKKNTGNSAATILQFCRSYLFREGKQGNTSLLIRPVV